MHVQSLSTSAMLTGAPPSTSLSASSWCSRSGVGAAVLMLTGTIMVTTRCAAASSAVGATPPAAACAGTTACEAPACTAAPPPPSSSSEAPSPSTSTSSASPSMLLSPPASRASHVAAAPSPGDAAVPGASGTLTIGAAAAACAVSSLRRLVCFWKAGASAGATMTVVLGVHMKYNVPQDDTFGAKSSQRPVQQGALVSPAFRTEPACTARHTRACATEVAVSQVALRVAGQPGGVCVRNSGGGGSWWQCR